MTFSSLKFILQKEEKNIYIYKTGKMIKTTFKFWAPTTS